jgi:hypothetical protein
LIIVGLLAFIAFPLRPKEAGSGGFFAVSGCAGKLCAASFETFCFHGGRQVNPVSA